MQIDIAVQAGEDCSDKLAQTAQGDAFVDPDCTNSFSAVTSVHASAGNGDALPPMRHWIFLSSSFATKLLGRHSEQLGLPPCGAPSIKLVALKFARQEADACFELLESVKRDIEQLAEREVIY